MKNRKTLSFLLMEGLLLSSCSGKHRDALVFIYDENDTFIRSFDTALGTALTKEGYSYESRYASNSQIKQNESIVESLDQNSPDMLFVNLVDRMSSGAIIDKVSTKDIPVIFFNRQPLDQDMVRGRKTNDKIFYVGTDPVFEGESQAKMTEELFGDKENLSPIYDKNHDGTIQLVMLKGEIGHQDTEKRSKAALETLTQDGYRIENLYSVYANWNRNQARQSMKEIVQKCNGEIEVVLCNNDDMALGVIDYLLSEENTIPWYKVNLPFPIFGVDGTSLGIEYVKKGLLSGTVKNEADRQADCCIKLVEEIKKNGEITSSFPYPMENEYTIYVEGKIITEDNVASASENDES